SNACAASISPRPPVRSDSRASSAGSPSPGSYSALYDSDASAVPVITGSDEVSSDTVAATAYEPASVTGTCAANVLPAVRSSRTSRGWPSGPLIRAVAALPSGNASSATTAMWSIPSSMREETPPPVPERGNVTFTRPDQTSTKTSHDAHVGPHRSPWPLVQDVTS